MRDPIQVLYSQPGSMIIYSPSDEYLVSSKGDERSCFVTVLRRQLLPLAHEIIAVAHAINRKRLDGNLLRLFYHPENLYDVFYMPKAEKFLVIDASKTGGCSAIPMTSNQMLSFGIEMADLGHYLDRSPKNINREAQPCIS